MQKVLSVFGCFVLIFALCTGCSRTPQAEKKTFYAMNTTMEFTVVVVKKSRHEKYLFLICFFKSRHEEYFCRSCFFKSGHGQ